MSAAISSRPAPDGFAELRCWSVWGTDDLSRFRESMLSALRSLTAEPAGTAAAGTGSAGTGAALQRDPRADPPAETAQDIVLVSSELAANALCHGGTPALVRLRSDGRSYLVEVIDGAPAAAPHVAGQRPAGRGGFGLRVADRLAREVGWFSTETAKHVWALFPAPRPLAAAG
ncbi:ATP-binding protein [Cellulomonas sp. PhB143]|uniref:ATP-binding protein n=1 Tax=Cellulomonas sp. PhB143 TaxID=2485186 RepID=UPI000FB66428|nr:ATP-binding protein [Cellulomonas sp. PhB143]ROS75285.1 hypothetical protein EDF32_1693 [Cellulomonas sp. PhB143]